MPAAATTHLGPLFIRGFDRYTRGTGQLRWRIFGHIPLLSATGPDVSRSAMGRLAGELCFVPAAALSPAVRWEPLDDQRALACVDAHGRTHRVTLTVAESSWRVPTDRERGFESRWRGPLPVPRRPLRETRIQKRGKYASLAAENVYCAVVTGSLYLPRLADVRLATLLGELPAVMVTGPRAAGKTTSARRLAADVLRLDDPAVATAVAANPDAALRRAREPVLVDEWHEVPEVLGAVKRAVDDDPRPGRFLLTGSVEADLTKRMWPGTGRIVRVVLHGLTQREITGAAAPRLAARPAR